LITIYNLIVIITCAYYILLSATMSSYELTLHLLAHSAAVSTHQIKTQWTKGEEAV